MLLASSGSKLTLVRSSSSFALLPRMKWLTALALLVQLSRAADKNAWKSRSIYFAMTDRIARRAQDSGGSACGDLGNYCGGTFAGLQGKLDYIKGMGFDALWISPIVASESTVYQAPWNVVI